MTVPLSDEIREHARVTTDGDARALLEGWIAKAEELEAGAGQGEGTAEHRAAALAGIRKAIRDRQIEGLLVLLCFERVRRMGLGDVRRN